MAILRVHVVPNATIDSVVVEHGAAIKIKLHAAVVGGSVLLTVTGLISSLFYRRDSHRAVV